MSCERVKWEKRGDVKQKKKCCHPKSVGKTIEK